MSLSLTPAQLNIINTYGAAKNYPAMYNYIATEMKAGRIAGASSDQIYWFDQAAKINAGDASSPASVFIRAATVAGLASSGASTDAAHIQDISNSIGEKVYADIRNGNAIPDFGRQLNADISAAINFGGMTIGGWGGAFYYWNAPYTLPNGTQTTVGEAIIASPAERSKFVNGMLTATETTIRKFGIDGLVNDQAFFPALGVGLRNMALSAPAFALQVSRELADEVVKYGAEAVRKFETELLRQSGWLISFDQLPSSPADVAQMAAGEFVDIIQGGGEASDESEALAQAVQAKLDQMLAGKDMTGAMVYNVPSPTADGTGAGAVFIQLQNGQSVTVNGSGEVAYRFNHVDDNGNALWTSQSFDETYKTALILATGGTDTRSYSATGQLQSQITTTPQPNGSITTATLDGQGNTLLTKNTQTFDDGSTIANTTYADGSSATRTTDDSGTLTNQSTTSWDNTHSFSTTYNYDGAGNIQNITTIKYYLDDTGQPSREEYVSTSSGTLQNVYDNEGNLFKSTPVVNGARAFNNAASTTASFISLIQALQSGKPLPIATAGVNTIVQMQAAAAKSNANTVLSGAGNTLNALNSLAMLNDSFKNGDLTATALAGSQAVVYGVTAYANYMGFVTKTFDVVTVTGQTVSVTTTALEAAETAGAISSSTASTVSSLSKAMPYLSLAFDIAHHDDTAAAIDLISLLPGLQWLGPVYHILGFFGDIFSSPPPKPWGNGRFVWNADGSLGVQAVGDHHGDTMMADTMNNLQDALQQSLALVIQKLHDQGVNAPIGLVVNRLPTVSLNDGAYALSILDPATGQIRTLHYDGNGRATDAVFGSDEYFHSFGMEFLYATVAQQGIAPQWEVDTAHLQTLANAPQAGLTELQRAQQNGTLAPAVTQNASNPATTETWRPIILDLNGDGVQTVSKAEAQVAFDVVGLSNEQTGHYHKATAWASRADGFLVLDRNFNGTVDTGDEMFSNSHVADAAKGLASMDWVDANADHRITALDPVFAQLRVWRDANGNGVMDDGEAHSLSELGITSLNYALGTYEHNGQTLQMASPDLVADVAGLNVNPVPGGIQVDTSDGKTTIIVTKTQDLSNIAPGFDGYVGTEDVNMDIPADVLLVNDHVGAIAGGLLQLVSVQDARHGTVTLSNGWVHFTPEANFNGVGAGFNYTVRDANGNTVVARVDITLAAVNDAPVVTGWGNFLITVYDERNRLINSYLDPNHGKLAVSDPDDTVLTYEIVGNPLQGVAAVTADGTWSFGQTGTTAGQDAFKIRVTDSHHTFTEVTITVPLVARVIEHPGGVGPSGSGGGGGGDGGGPIILDLDRNGITLQAASQSTAFYDYKDDGWRYQMGWTQGGDGLLAFDANGDGAISGQREISFTGYVPSAQTDLEGLAFFDTNHDGQLNAQDAQWDKFKVWVDANGNGASEAGELRTLTQAGISAISLTSDHQFSNQNGNTIHGMAQVTMVDGSHINAADATLAVTDQVLWNNPDGTQQVLTRPAGSAASDVIGSADADVLVGTTGNNYINAGAGDDFIFDDQGNDVVEAGDGNDVIYSGSGQDVINAGAGDDAVFAGLANDMVLGGAGADALMGEGGDDILFGNDGDDLLDGGTGNDLLSGGNGEDTVMGGAGFDAMFGGAGNDTLDGGTGDDTMQGDAGNDTYVVDSVGDVVIENLGEGADTINTRLNQYVLGANIENLTLTGTAQLTGSGNELGNTLTANGAGDTLYGLAGNDTLIGGSGVDTLVGGVGNDTYVIQSLSDVVVENAGEGSDTVVTSLNYTLADVLENLTLTGGSALNGTGNAQANVITANNAGDTLYGLDGNDTLRGGRGNDRLDGGSGIDAMFGGQGDDTYYVDSLTDLVSELANEGVDTVVASTDYSITANVENLVLVGAATTGYGSALDNLLTGNAGDNDLYGLGGNDILDGGAGNDVLSGGAGNDTYLFGRGDGQDFIATDLDASSTKLNVLRFKAGVNPADVIVTRNSSTLIFSIANSSDSITAVQFFTNNDPANASNPLQQVQFADGTVWTIDMLKRMVLAGNDTAQTLTGYASDDVISALGGNDTVNGMAGNDVLDGGDGNDNVQGGDGNDSVRGGAGTDTLGGGNGDDILDGGAGLDTLSGGAGNDTYLFGYGDAQDTITLDSELGVNNVLQIRTGVLPGAVSVARLGANLVVTLAGSADKVSAVGFFDDGDTRSVSRTLQQLRFADGTVWDASTLKTMVLTGTAAAQTLTGYASDDIINALGGNDVVYGLGGNDTLDGGDGNDNLQGGDGNDLLRGSAGNDTLTGGNGDDTLDGGVGNDVLSGNAGSDNYLFALGDGADTLMESDTASDTNTIVFGSGIAPGSLQVQRSGLDLVVRYSASDSVTLQNWFGGDYYRIDRIRFTDSTAVWDVNQLLRQINAAPTGSVSVTGIAATGQTLTASNTLADADGLGTFSYQWQSLEGGTWTNISGANATTFTLTQAQLGKQLRVLASYTDAYGTQESVASAAITQGGGTFTGTSGDDLLVGSPGNDTLDGGLGVDAMVGGTGDDIYLVDNSADEVVEEKGQGVDTVVASVDYALDANIENLTLVGDAVKGYGNGLNNTIIASARGSDIYGGRGDDTLIGGAGNDILNGGMGADAMFGGAGDDIYRVDDTLGMVVEEAGEGIDTIVTSVNYALDANIENLILVGVATEGYGNSLNNTLTANNLGNLLYGARGNDTLIGGKGNDNLNGGQGADVMAGGAGDDSYAVDSAGDVVSESFNQGTDLVSSSVTYTLGSNIENLTLSGTTAINGSGNELNNALKGNSAANILTGGLGNDTLTGGAGNDTYVFARGDGQDIIVENDAAAGNTDVLQLVGDISLDQLRFGRSGNDLQISIIGTTDKVIEQNWYLGNQYHVEQIKSSDGHTLTDANVQALVQALATMSALPPGQALVSAANQDQLQPPVLAVNW